MRPLRRRKQNTLLLLEVGGPSGPRLSYVPETVPEDASVDDLAATLSILNGPEGVSWTFTLGGGAPAEFALDVMDDTRLLVAGALDYETETFHDVPIVATSDEDPATVLTRTIRIPITNVIETPVNFIPPTVTGVAQVGEVIECVPGAWTDMQEGSSGVRSYQWYDAADDSEIVGADSRFFSVTGEWVGESVYCEETATNSAGSASEDTDVVGPFDPAPGFGAGDGFLILNDGAISGLHLGMI